MSQLSWLARITGAYGNKCYFSDFQVLGCQPGNEVLGAVSLCNGETTTGMTEVRQVLSPFNTLFEHICHIHAVHSYQPGKAWLGVNQAFVVGANELNSLTESMYYEWGWPSWGQSIGYMVCSAANDTKPLVENFTNGEQIIMNSYTSAIIIKNLNRLTWLLSC